MPTVVVAGSDADPFFAIVDFTDPDNPVVQRIAPDQNFPFGACRVAISGTTIIAGDSQGSDLRLLDVSDTANPATIAFLRTNLAGVAAVNIKGPRVVVGEGFGAGTVRVQLIDIANPTNPRIIGTAIVPFASGNVPGGNPPIGPPSASAISSVAFVTDSVIAVAGPNQLQISLVNFSNPVHPEVTNFSATQLAGAPAMDAKNGKFAAGDGNGSHVNLFAGLQLLASFQTGLFPVTQVAMSDAFILATSAEDAQVVCIPLAGGNIQPLQPGLGLGLIPNLEDTVGVCGGFESTFLRLIDLSVDPPVVIGAKANVEFQMVTSIGISVFGATGPRGGPIGTGGGGRSGGSGGVGGAPPRVPTFVGGGGSNLTRPVGLRAIIVAAGLKPERGLRIIRPAIVSVFEFAVRSFEEIVHYTE